MARVKKKGFKRRENIIFLFLAVVIIWLLGNMLVRDVALRFVKTQTVVKQQLEDVITGYGQLSGGETFIIAQADGVVSPIIKEGERVRKGNAVCKVADAFSYTNYAGRVSYHLDGLEGVTDLNGVCSTDLEKRYHNQKNDKSDKKDITVSSGDVCAKVINIFDEVYVYLTIPYNEYTGSLEIGKSYLLRFKDADYEIKGSLTEALDTQDGHRYLKLKVRGVKEILFDQRLYEVDMPYNQLSTVTVPSSALVEQNGETGIYYLQKGFVFWKPVTVGETKGDLVTITEGLNVGNIIVTTPRLVRVGTKLNNF